jgi:predicted MFS family arabinose efflux permease
MTAAPDRPRNPLDPRNPLAGLYLAAMLFELAEGALRFLVPVNLDARGLAPDAIGLIIFGFSLTSLLARGVTGAVFRPDRARALVIVAGLASTVAYLPVPFVDDPRLFALLMGLDGFGWGVATTCLLALVMLRTPPEIPAAVSMGWYIGFQGVAMGLASSVGGILGEAIGVPGAMLTLAVLPVVAGVLIAWRIPAAPDGQRGTPGHGSPAAPDPSDQRPSTRRLDVLRTLPGAVWVAALAALYLNVMNGLLQTFFPLLGLALGLSLAQIGTLGTVRAAVSTVSRFGAGWLVARIPAHRLHAPLLVLSAGTLALLPAAGSYLLLLPLLALNGVARGLLRVTTSAAAMTATPAAQAGLAAAVMSAGLDVGKMVGPLLGGAVASGFGLETMFRVVPLAFLVVGLIVLVLIRQETQPTSLAEIPVPEET